MKVYVEIRTLEVVLLLQLIVYYIFRKCLLYEGLC